MTDPELIQSEIDAKQKRRARAIRRKEAARAEAATQEDIQEAMDILMGFDITEPPPAGLTKAALDQWRRTMIERVLS